MFLKLALLLISRERLPLSRSQISNSDSVEIRFDEKLMTDELFLPHQRIEANKTHSALLAVYASILRNHLGLERKPTTPVIAFH
jgi:hypothetical protein